MPETVLDTKDTILFIDRYVQRGERDTEKHVIVVVLIIINEYCIVEGEQSTAIVTR